MKVLFATLTKHDEPLGIMYLSRILKDLDYDVRGVMLQREDIFKVVAEFKPDVIAYSAMSCEKKEILRINGLLKGAHTFFSLIGGPLATFSPEIIDNKDIDALCVGEGEQAVAELLHGLHTKKDIRHIKNMWVRHGSKIYKNALRPPIKDIDALPFPDRTIFKEFKTDGAYYISTGRGCPFNCSYCYNRRYKKLYGRHGPIVRYRTIDNVLAELNEIVRTFPVAMFWFQDDHFYSDRKVLTEFTRKYTSQINTPFKICMRPEYLSNEETVRSLREANCAAVFTGCEAGNDRIRQKILKRNVSKEEIVKACDVLNTHNMNVVLQNMVGIPTAEYEHDIETLELNVRCKPYYAWVSICTPYPGTEIFDIAQRAGLIGENYLDELYDTYHFKTSLSFPHADRVNVLHKLFALVVEYPALLPIIKQQGFYEGVSDRVTDKLKDIFVSFKQYKYEKLHNQKLQVPNTVTRFVETLLARQSLLEI